MNVFWTLVAAAGFLGAIWLFLSGYLGPGRAEQQAGWVYFLSPIDGGDEERPAPIKIGMTHRDPGVDRLPEIETMSPEPLKVLYCFRTGTPFEEEQKIHADLAPYRLHGEWFDRYPTLMYLDNLKGQA